MDENGTGLVLKVVNFSVIERAPSGQVLGYRTHVKLLVVDPRYFDALLEQTPDLWREIAIALCDYLPSTCYFPLEIEATDVTG